MGSMFDFTPNGVIRQRRFITSGEPVTCVFYETTDNKFVISFLKGMNILKEKNVTEKWLACKSIYEIDAIMDSLFNELNNQ